MSSLRTSGLPWVVIRTSSVRSVFRVTLGSFTCRLPLAIVPLLRSTTVAWTMHTYCSLIEWPYIGNFWRIVFILGEQQCPQGHFAVQFELNWVRTYMRLCMFGLIPFAKNETYDWNSSLNIVNQLAARSFITKFLWTRLRVSPEHQRKRMRLMLQIIPATCNYELRAFEDS